MTALSKPQRVQKTKRPVILKAAERVFSREGFGGSTVDSIVAEAEVSKRTFYQHFKNKDEILLELVRLWCGEILVPLGNERKPAVTGSIASVRKVLQDTASAYLSVMLSPAGRELFRIVVAEAPRFPALARQFYETGHEPAAQAVANTLYSTFAEHGLSEKDARLLAEQFFVLTRGYLHDRALLGIDKRPSANEVARCTGMAVDILLGGIIHSQSRSNKLKFETT